MPVLTCSDMVAQCLAGQPSGWKHFINEYLPFAGALRERHFPEQMDLVSEVLRRAAADDALFFREYAGQSEREFLLHLRGHVFRIAEEQERAVEEPEIPLASETFESALTSLSALERQVVWMFLLSPAAGDTDKILRLAPRTAGAHMAKAQELLRTSTDRWNAEMLAGNRVMLISTARAGGTGECAAPTQLLHMLDGQMTWRARADLEHQLTTCWHCVDLFCRLREVAFLAHGAQPLPVATVAFYLEAVGMGPAKPSRWKLGR